MSYATDAGYHRFCADVIEHIDGRRLSESENVASRILASLYAAGYKDFDSIDKADEAELLKVRNVSARAVSAIKGRDCPGLDDRYSFECARCGEKSPKEGAFRVEVTVRDRIEPSGRMGVAAKRAYKLCPSCGSAVHGVIRNEVGSDD